MIFIEYIFTIKLYYSYKTECALFPNLFACYRLSKSCQSRVTRQLSFIFTVWQTYNLWRFLLTPSISVMRSNLAANKNLTWISKCLRWSEQDAYKFPKMSSSRGTIYGNSGTKYNDYRQKYYDIFYNAYIVLSSKNWKLIVLLRNTLTMYFTWNYRCLSPYTIYIFSLLQCSIKIYISPSNVTTRSSHCNLYMLQFS